MWYVCVCVPVRAPAPSTFRPFHLSFSICLRLCRPPLPPSHRPVGLATLGPNGKANPMSDFTDGPPYSGREAEYTNQVCVVCVRVRAFTMSSCAGVRACGGACVRACV